MNTPESLPSYVDKRFIRKSLPRRVIRPEEGALYVAVFHPVRFEGRGFAFLSRVEERSLGIGRLSLRIYSTPDMDRSEVNNTDFDDGFVSGFRFAPPGYSPWKKAHLLERDTEIDDELEAMMREADTPNQLDVLIDS